MRAVLGLGNPGSRYQFTRHNIGYILLDLFAKKHDLKFDASRKDYYYSKGELLNSPFVLIKPTTYMNLSGIAAADLIADYQIPLNELLVVYDDINLEPGQIRIRKSGSDGGHNGLHSIIYHLGSENFPRLRFGIGSEFGKGDLSDYVLSRFTEKELSLLERSFTLGVELIEVFIKEGLNKMLDVFSSSSQTYLSNPNTQQKKEGK